MRSVYLSVLAVLVCSVSAQTAPDWGQCGGQGWSGPTLCPAGWSCTVLNPFFFQCLMSTTTATTTTPTTVSSSGTTSIGSTTSTAGGGSATLVPGWSFVRAVEDPNFHKYLMSQVTSTPTTAILGDFTLAAQFQVVNGQLIQNAGGTNLYAVVNPPANSTVTKLGLTWSTKPDTLGTFVFSGDSLEWSSPTVPRQQTNAWLVCPANNTLFVYINLGAYGFMTPTGCADETLNAYTGATAVP